MNHLTSPRRRHAASRSVAFRGARRWCLAGWSVGVLAVAALSAPEARGAVQTQLLDDVFPIDNPFTPSVDEGLPDNGNSINPAKGMNAAAQGDPRTSYGSVPPDYSPPYFESRLDVIVGRTGSGTVVINGGSDLRYEDLIIGGFNPGADPSQGGPPPPGSGRGSGTVRIEGTGSLYNNNYTLLPPAIADGNPFGISWGTSIRAQDDVDGFDLYVGRQYDGVLRLSLGGRVEIQDAVIVGDSGASTGGGTAQFASYGRIEVDGFESTLISGGYPNAMVGDDLPHQMIIGRLGTGEMYITNGGRVTALGPLLQAGDTIVGGVVGSDPLTGTGPPGASGNGLVDIIGPGSVWTVGGILQIGGFHDALDLTGPSTTEEDLEGNDVDYSVTNGEDFLYVRNGGLVSIISPFTDPNAQPPERLDFLVGFTGRVILEGGRIESLGVLRQTQQGSTPTQQVSFGRLINDGFVSGDGSITTLQFRNRALGQVTVGAGEKLSIAATGLYAEMDNIPIPGEQEYPLSNYGVISALGTETSRAEIEFDRAPVPASLVTPTNFTRPFLNLPVTGPAAANGRTEGLIQGEWSIMRFRSGLWNRGVLAFTRGDNVVSGDVISFADSAPGADDHGRVVLGPNTNVAFQDDFFSFGTLQIHPGATFEILAGNSFAVDGTMDITVQGSPLGLTFNPFLVAGNATFGGTLNVTITNGASVPPLSSVPLFNVGGSIFGNFAQVNALGSPLEFFTFALGGSLFLQSFDPMLAVGPDFNGDGTVDLLDLQIWRQNLGGPGPAGDANGDGLVNGLDFYEWQRAAAMPGAGSGGLPGHGGSVPEPASAALVACGAMLALLARRRTMPAA